jgi:hypothetical protein
MKKRPQRTCIGCQRVLGKRELTRLVRTPSGEVKVDPTGKLAGRGAYLCKNRRCWQEALAHKRIEHALKLTLTAEQHAALEAYASELPDVDTVSET